MMMRPPTTTSREAHRSRRIRRLVRAGETTSGWAGNPGPPAPRSAIASALMAIYWILFSSSFVIEAGSGK